MAIYEYKGKKPRLGQECFIAESADLIGEVILGDHSSVWFSAVVRGDIAPVTIGDYCNIQDGCIVHVEHDMPTKLGKNVTVGHGAIIHAATVGDNCLIGMKAVLLDECVIGEGSVIAAGSVVPPRMVVPPFSQVMGVPGKVVKTLDTQTEQQRILHATAYSALADDYWK